ncbi:uncharacterized protein [Henckelia pumila]|uniref:uncharacterized protein n=1 Tax=Henckelia pumila TaxID=405737 RepID=UPI003C6E0622
MLIDRLGSWDAVVTRMDVWFGQGRGLKNTYYFFLEARGRWHWKPILWKACILPKHMIILWLLAHGKLLTKDRLGHVEDKVCGFCNAFEESVRQLFFNCAITTTIWDRVREWLGMRKLMRSVKAIGRAFKGVYRGSSTLASMRVSALAATVYRVWTSRNRTIFEGEKLNIDDATRRIKLMVLRCVSMPCNIFL